MSQLEIWSMIASSAINFIVVYVITGLSQKATVTDMKTDLRTTKEDIMTELKESRSVILTEIENAATASKELVTATIKGHEGDTNG